MAVPKLTYYCDNLRHLVCVPYTIANLHRMAEDLGIKRCWYQKFSDNLARWPSG
jgi:hypothetical protein